jgi:hypothetical protein
MKNFNFCTLDKTLWGGGGHVCSTYERDDQCIQSNPEWMRPLERHWLTLEDNIKRDFREILCGDVDWI